MEDKEKAAPVPSPGRSARAALSEARCSRQGKGCSLCIIPGGRGMAEAAARCEGLKRNYSLHKNIHSSGGPETIPLGIEQ